MGTDKATIEIDGVSMLDRAVEALLMAGAQEIWVVGARVPGRQAENIAYIPDRWPLEGPLGGLVCGLEAAEEAGAQVAVLLPCDGVAPSASTIRSMVDDIGNHDVVVPVVGGDRQYLHAVWQSACSAMLRQRFDAGERSLHRALRSFQVRWLDESTTAWQPEADAFRDADTPGDLP